MAKILVAMSGGVDSSMVLVLLHEQGHDVTGMTLHLWDSDANILRESQCCSQEMVDGARRVCTQIGVPHYVLNYQKEFRRHVIDYFIEQYTSGVTPNPCLRCNRDIKFRLLLERTRMLGFDYLATGHYAQIAPPPVLTSTGEAVERFALLRAHDKAKDQSYVLYMLDQQALSQIQFPLGSFTKTEVREMARQRGLPTASRAESQDLCFIPDNNYRRFLRDESPENLVPGPILNQADQPIGQHQGLPLYTVGQRKGLGVHSPEPLFVTALDPSRNALIVGPLASTYVPTCQVEQVQIVSGDWPDKPVVCTIQIRAHAPAVPATIIQVSQQW